MVGGLDSSLERGAVREPPASRALDNTMVVGSPSDGRSVFSSLKYRSAHVQKGMQKRYTV